ncbi:hypothetical protein [Streptomyces sp. NPDC017448]|uniref:hypothetical protein n=1 Tax=Streptomyces sp. NPDC017448 TaxID=3364996 RepID=UPI003796C06F
MCGKPVPPGELTHLSLNSRSGHYLALCAECRTDLEEEMLHWMAARVGVGQLQSALLELPNKELVSHGDLRKVLIENGALTRKQGPLTQEELEYAVELRDGPEAREWVEKHG